MAPIGKKLVGNPYWSIHIGKYRVIYIFHKHSSEIEIIDLLSRKHDYRRFNHIFYILIEKLRIN
ncbi:Uncharacterised protein [uncultured archaeon]|nr:Uncharacterised protein [uncultured archaeon]